MNQLFRPISQVWLPSCTLVGILSACPSGQEAPGEGREQAQRSSSPRDQPLDQGLGWETCPVCTAALSPMPSSSDDVKPSSWFSPACSPCLQLMRRGIKTRGWAAQPPDWLAGCSWPRAVTRWGTDGDTAVATEHKARPTPSVQNPMSCSCECISMIP